MRKLFLTLVWGVFLSLAARTAPTHAQIVDPATLHIGSGQGTACVAGGCPQWAGEINLVGVGTFDINRIGGGDILNSAVLAILLVPNDAGSIATPLLGSTATLYATASTSCPCGSGTSVAVNPGLAAASYTGTNPTGFSLALNTTTGYVGNMTAGDAYTFLAGYSSSTVVQNLFTHADNSVNIGNLQGGDLAIAGVTATSYGVYVYGANVQLSPGNVLNFSFSSVPKGTYVIGFGYTGDGTKGANPYDTAFTESGFWKTETGGTGGRGAPEPASLTLFGVGLAALGVLRRRKAA